LAVIRASAVRQSLSRFGIVALATATFGWSFVTATARAQNIQGRIASVGTDENIYFCEGSCTKPVCVTCQANGVEVRRNAPVHAELINVSAQPVEAARPQAAANHGWVQAQSRAAQNGLPTFSPNGEKLAYTAAVRTPEGLSSSVEVYDFARKTSTPIFNTTGQPPIYLFWLPDNQTLSFLDSAPEGELRLMITKAEQSAKARVVTAGAPLYFDWNQPLHKLVIHTSSAGELHAEQIAILSMTDDNQQFDKVISIGYAPFKSPAWSNDGRHLAYVVARDEQTHLMLADPNGSNPTAIATLPDGESSFVWAPDSRHIAFATGEFDNGFIFYGISLLDIATGAVKKLTGDPVTAYFFSPDSRHLAFIGVPRMRPYFTWEVMDLISGTSRHLANFVTTREESISYRYFEQLALSHTIWAPDSSAFTFSGVLLVGETPPSSRFAPPPVVWMMPINGAKPRPTSEGTLSFWSPPQSK
jgi:Tol biopolymer transport system component